MGQANNTKYLHVWHSGESCACESPDTNQFYAVYNQAFGTKLTVSRFCLNCIDTDRDFYRNLQFDMNRLIQLQSHFYPKDLAYSSITDLNKILESSWDKWNSIILEVFPSLIYCAFRQDDGTLVKQRFSGYSTKEAKLKFYEEFVK